MQPEIAAYLSALIKCAKACVGLVVGVVARIGFDGFLKGIEKMLIPDMIILYEKSSQHIIW